jgi:RNA polymerase sigma-70 factor (ECF subfamily)
MPEKPDSFAVQAAVRDPWRAFVDELAPLRPELHRYCCGLTGNVWDGEDLVQDTLARVFGLLGRISVNVEHPRAYLVRVATHLWIDRVRRASLERAYAASQPSDEPVGDGPASHLAVRDAANELFLQLAPQERAAVLLKDVLDFSLEDVSSLLKTTVGAVKSALHRGRSRLARAKAEERPAQSQVPRELVDRFVAALGARDIESIRALCLADVTVEMVGGFTAEGFERGKVTLEHAHVVLPQLGFGANPHWRSVLYHGEPIALGFRTLDGLEGINEIWRLEPGEGGVAKLRLYCFSPDVLATVGRELGIPALKRPYRSPF